jgi:hypothetical protein
VGRGRASLACAGSGAPVDYEGALEAGRVLAPMDHPDPAHCNITGAGPSAPFQRSPGPLRQGLDIHSLWEYIFYRV